MMVSLRGVVVSRGTCRSKNITKRCGASQQVHGWLRSTGSHEWHLKTDIWSFRNTPQDSARQHKDRGFKQCQFPLPTEDAERVHVLLVRPDMDGLDSLDGLGGSGDSDGSGSLDELVIDGVGIF